MREHLALTIMLLAAAAAVPLALANLGKCEPADPIPPGATGGVVVCVTETSVRNATGSCVIDVGFDAKACAPNATRATDAGSCTLSRPSYTEAESVIVTVQAPGAQRTTTVSHACSAVVDRGGLTQTSSLEIDTVGWDPTFAPGETGFVWSSQTHNGTGTCTFMLHNSLLVAGLKLGNLNPGCPEQQTPPALPALLP